MTLQVNSTAVNEVYLNHNVGYTIVGSPTITDGVVSGFSADDYLSLPAFRPGNNPWEIVTSFITPISVDSTYRGIISKQGNLCLNIQHTGSKGVEAAFSHNGANLDIGFIRANNIMDSNTRYWIKVEFTGSQYEVSYKKEGSTYTSIGTIQSSMSIQDNNNPLNIGVSRALTAYSNSIYLNNTHIKVNGITFFNGKETASSTVNEVYYNKNCGYTVVGNPTITDGVASGFSASNYLSLPEINLANPFEIFFKIKTPATWGSAYDVILSPSTSNRYGFQKNGPNKQFSYYVPNESGTGRTQHNGNTGLLEDTIYYIRTRFTGTQLIIDRSTDKTNWTVEWQENRTVGFFSSAYAIGRNATAAQQAWMGSIDLNNTYIKVNGITFFNGKQAASNAVWTRGV